LACMLPLRNFQVQTFRLSNHAQTGNAHSCERRLKRYWLWSEFFISEVNFFLSIKLKASASVHKIWIQIQN
jgi:hypothetical protein